jgi:hypothetical protein
MPRSLRLVCCSTTADHRLPQVVTHNAGANRERVAFRRPMQARVAAGVAGVRAGAMRPAVDTAG